MKNILVIVGHPSMDSFNGALAKKYIDGVEKKGNEVRLLHIGSLKFEPVLTSGYKDLPELEPDLKKSQDLIKWADHFAIINPTWWATPPALFKAFFERVFLPDFAFKYKKSKHVVAWDKFLTGKSARFIITMDTPPWFFKLVIGNPAGKMMKDILSFCGIKPVKGTYFGSVKMSTPEKREKWLEKTYRIGLKEA
ncbi:MAG: NAD(P)H-dependent oxidoreductase [Candidatus Aminicenantes bacterium]|nr:NAD(P)H-dependent oxidoreductase [Candidatus Aminicenantes bacterium]